MSTFQPSAAISEILPQIDQEQFFTEFCQGYDFVQLAIPRLSEQLEMGTDPASAIYSMIDLMTSFYRAQGLLDSNFQNDLKALITLTLRRATRLNGLLGVLFSQGSAWATAIAPEATHLVADAIQSAITEIGVDSFLISFPHQQSTYGIAFQPLAGAADPQSATQLLDTALELVRLELAEFENPVNVIILNGGRTIATELGVARSFSLPATTSHGTELSEVVYDPSRLDNLLQNIDQSPDQPIIIYDDGIDRGATLLNLLIDLASSKGLTSLESECVDLYKSMLDSRVMKDEQGRLGVAKRFWRLALELQERGIHLVAAVDKLCGIDPVNLEADADSPFFRLAQIVDIDDDPEQRRKPAELPWLMGRGGFDTKVVVMLDARPLTVSIGRNLPYLVNMLDPTDRPIQKLQQLVIDVLVGQIGIDAQRVALPLDET